MSFLRAAATGTIVNAVSLSSKVVSIASSPTLTKLSANIVARFLPTDIGNALLEIVDAIHNEFPDLNVIDINSALTVTAILHARSKQPVFDIRSYCPVEDSAIAKEFSHFTKFASAAYGRRPVSNFASALRATDQDWIRHETGLPYSKIDPYVDTKAVRNTHMLEHFVAIDDEQEAVIVSLKGTGTIAGALKDIRAAYSKVTLWGEEFEVHSGMIKSAQSLAAFPTLISQITRGLDGNRDYKLVILGHSLGGGVAVLLASLLSTKSADGVYLTNDKITPGRPIICYGFEPAASVDYELGQRTKAFTYSLVNRNDIIPSLSYGAILDFKEVAQFLKTDVSYHKKILDDLVSNSPRIEEHLKFVRGLASHKKLVPPGRVWSLHQSDLGNTEIGEIMNVNERFGEARFIRGMIGHHSLEQCVYSLKKLRAQ